MKAQQLRKPPVESILRQHRIRRVDADTILQTLREPAIKVADGVVEAASIHLRSRVARLRVVNRELRELMRIPMHRGHLLRFDRGQATDLMAATIPI